MYLLTMREWLLDLEFNDIDSDEIDELSKEEIYEAIDRHYAGGVAQFIAEEEEYLESKEEEQDDIYNNINNL